MTPSTLMPRPQAIPASFTKSTIGSMPIPSSTISQGMCAPVVVMTLVTLPSFPVISAISCSERTSTPSRISCWSTRSEAVGSITSDQRVLHGPEANDHSPVAVRCRAALYVLLAVSSRLCQPGTGYDDPSKILQDVPTVSALVLSLPGSP